jgi:high affinity sulfate transporter 1
VWAGADIVAGLTVWAVLVPEALAYATIAGVSPVVGLYAAPGALLLYAIFGSSKHLVVAPMAATAALSAAAVADVTTGGANTFAALTATLAITAGLVAVVAGLLRLGFLANFVSEPVLKGFIVGLALTIIVGQVPKLLGVTKGSGDFFDQLWHLIGNLGQTQGVTLLVGFGSLAAVLGLRYLAPPVIPAPLVVVVLSIVATRVFGLDDHGVDIVGHIDRGLPSLGFPHVAAVDYLELAPAAIGIMLVGFAEGLGAAKHFATKHGYDLDANRELVGLGAANVAAGLSSGMVVNGSLSKTAVNESAGAKTQASGLVAAGLTIVTLLFLSGLFEDLPEATLGAVVIAALVELVDVRSLVALYRTYTSRLGRIYGPAARADLIGAIAALLGVLIFDTLPGLFIGIGVSFLLLLYRSSRPHVAVLGQVPGGEGQWADVATHPQNRTVPGIVVLRVESGLFFANTDHVRFVVHEAVTGNDVHALVLDCETVPFIDVTAARMLVELEGELHARGVRFAMARDVGQVRDVLERTGGRDALRPIYRSVREAVDSMRESNPGGK